MMDPLLVDWQPPKSTSGRSSLGRRHGARTHCFMSYNQRKVVLPTDPNCSLELAIFLIDGASPLRHAWHQVLLWGHESQVRHARSPAFGFARPAPAVRAVCPARGRHRSAPPDPTDALDCPRPG